MNGNFELEHSCYPIGYLRSTDLYGSSCSGPLYKLTDMRDLSIIIPQDLSTEEATVLAAKLNSLIRERLAFDLADKAEKILKVLRG